MAVPPTSFAAPRGAHSAPWGGPAAMMGNGSRDTRNAAPGLGDSGLRWGRWCAHFRCSGQRPGRFRCESDEGKGLEGRPEQRRTSCRLVQTSAAAAQHGFQLGCRARGRPPQRPRGAGTAGASRESAIALLGGWASFARMGGARLLPALALQDRVLAITHQRQDDRRDYDACRTCRRSVATDGNIGPTRWNADRHRDLHMFGCSNCRLPARPVRGWEPARACLNTRIPGMAATWPPTQRPRRVSSGLTKPRR